QGGLATHVDGLSTTGTTPVNIADLLKSIFKTSTYALPVQGAGMSLMQINALHVAIGELTKGVADGRGETRLSSQVKVYLVYCYASYPNPWCAAFLSWCLGQAARMSGYQLPVFRTASTIDLGIFANHQALVLMGTDDSEPGDFYVLALDVDNPQTDF